MLSIVNVNPANKIALKLVLSLFLVAVFDWLFYDQPVGWTIGLYAGLALTSILFISPRLLKSLAGKLLILGCMGMIFSLIINPSVLAVFLFSLGLMALTILQKRMSISDLFLILKDMGRFLLSTFFRWFIDLNIFLKIHRKRNSKSFSILRIISIGIIPFIFASIFGLLFVIANPLIAREFFYTVDVILLLVVTPDPLRISIWIFVATLIWAYLRPRFQLAKVKTPSKSGFNLDLWMNKTSLVLSLALFNIIFAVPNILDMLFLWSGETSPPGVTYAEYAHQGAYSLIFTVLLASAYVLVIFNDKDHSYESPMAIFLAYAWIAQNIILVFSSIYRTLLYIGDYSLTHWRLWALIWMGLIAVGLVLIIARIYLKRSNKWLINWNVATVLVTLFVSCFINFTSIIAFYNVMHSKEVTGKGPYLDLGYMFSLNQDALQAMYWFEKNIKYPNPKKYSFDSFGTLCICIDGLDSAQIYKDLIARFERMNKINNWRAWTWSKYNWLLK